jgi:hypothetical protein
MNDAYEKVKEWEQTRCRKHMPRKVMGRMITFLCLRPSGHDGPCMEGIVADRDDIVMP